MSKPEILWACQHCSHTQLKWAGSCPQCKQWNCLDKRTQELKALHSVRSRSGLASPISLAEISTRPIAKLSTQNREFDRLLGGGITPGSLILIGGDPGVGKSTLMLQICQSLATGGSQILYVSGEESAPQIAMRARRLGASAEKLFLLCETEVGVIKECIDKLVPDIVVIDSIQVLYRQDLPSSPGSAVQLRETTAELLHIAKRSRTAIFLIGHVTKSGEIAGPKLLEHMVDSVLYFEGDRNLHYRIVRVIKNRFGPSDEIALFHMTSKGLVEAEGPSQIFMQNRAEQQPGSVALPVIEGSRAMLVEIQALVTKTHFSTPTRRCTGLDPNRLALLIAVAERHLRYPLHQCDIFVAVAGGLRISDPAADLAVLSAIASSWRKIPIDAQTLTIGEVGLTGEVRAVRQLPARLKEGALMHFQRCILPASVGKGRDSTSALRLLEVHTAIEAMDYLFGGNTRASREASRRTAPSALDLSKDKP